MHIVTWNINGLRSISQKGFAEWFKKSSPDIIVLQEIKATFDDVHHLLKEWSSFYAVKLNPALKKGYSGTALMIKKDGPQPLSIKLGLDLPQFDCEGRFIWAEFLDFYILNGYFPNGKEDHSRVEYKLEFSNAVFDLALKLQKKKGVLIAGDLNTAHREIDLARPEKNINSTGFLPRERLFLDKMLLHQFYDAFRVKHPLKKEEYTWWSYRGGCREKNIGWRLDYFFIDEKIKARLKEVNHLQSILGSDHAPVEIYFD